MKTTKCTAYWYIGLLIVLLALVGAGCGSAPPPDDTITVEDLKGAQGESVEEILPANNCQGATAMIIDLPASKQFTHEVKVFPQGGAKINVAAVRGAVRDYYQVDNLTSETVCSIPVNVPAGGYYVYELEWTENWREGTVEIGKVDSKPEARYRFRESMVCEVVGVQTQSCPGK